MDCKSKCEQGQYQHYTDAQGVSVTWLMGSRAAEIIPRTVIGEEIWGINFDSDTNTVDVAICSSAQKLAILSEKANRHNPGMGYLFVAVKIMKRLSITVRLTLLLLLLLSVAGAGIVWPL